MQVELVDVRALSPDPRNARKHGRRNLAAITAALQAYGQQKPIVIDAAGRIIAGNGTHQAALALGWERIYAVRTTLEEYRARGYAIADNRTAELAEWDEDALAAELRELGDVDGFDPAPLGYEEKDVARLTRPELPTEAGGRWEKPTNPVTRVGDLWLLGDHRLLCGDSTSPEVVGRLLQGDRVFQVVTDPPYGVEYDPSWRAEARIGIRPDLTATTKVENDERADWGDALQLLDADVVYHWCGSLRLHVVASALERVGYELRAQIVWARHALKISRGHYHWQHEPCWYAVREGRTARWAGDRKESTVWSMTAPKDFYGHSEDDATAHPTQKPLEAMARPMWNHGDKGDVVADPFLGSGTSLLAADGLNRRGRFVELDPAWCDVAIERWEQASGKKARRA